MVEFKHVDEVVCDSKSIPFEELIAIVKDVLSTDAVKKPVVIDDEGKVISGQELCIALKILGVRYLPVVRKGFQEALSISLKDLGFFDDISPTPLKVFRSSEELLIKNWPTPLLQLKSESDNRRRVWAKLEGFNPFSMSVKDRIGWYMFRKAVERYGGRVPTLLVEATSTNTGLALAAMCGLHGSKLRAYIPSTISKTGELLLKLFGAEVVRSDKPLTVDLISDVEEVARKLGALHLNQFYNDANFEVHLRYTAKELELQVREAGIKPKAIIGGLGTSGHMSAIALYFKSRFNGVKIYGVVPKEGTAIQGIRRVESGMKWVHNVEIDGIVDVHPEEAINSVIELARKEGILVGLSSGAVHAAYRKVGGGEGDYILIFPDHGFKYVEQLGKYFERG
ncbi:MAG: PLP-dependent cysteine synthase family protein [Sulfolobales archaeon]